MTFFQNVVTGSYDLGHFLRIIGGLTAVLFAFAYGALKVGFIGLCLAGDEINRDRLQHLRIDHLDRSERDPEEPDLRLFQAPERG